MTPCACRTAEHDLTTKLAPFLDLHFMFPMLSFAEKREVCGSERKPYWQGPHSAHTRSARCLTPTRPSDVLCRGRASCDP